MWGDEFTFNDEGLPPKNSSSYVERIRIESPARAHSGPSERSDSCDIMLSDEEIPDESEDLPSISYPIKVNKTNRINQLRSSFLE